MKWGFLVGMIFVLSCDKICYGIDPVRSQKNAIQKVTPVQKDTHTPVQKDTDTPVQKGMHDIIKSQHRCFCLTEYETMLVDQIEALQRSRCIGPFKAIVLCDLKRRLGKSLRRRIPNPY